MTAQILNYSLKNDVAMLTMDDGKANALGHAMIAALTEALDRAQNEAKAVLISGREKRFCAGFDLKTAADGSARDWIAQVDIPAGWSDPVADPIPGPMGPSRLMSAPRRYCGIWRG